MKHLAIKPQNSPLLVGITGASGSIYGVRLLELLRACNVEAHLIVSRAAQMTLAYETSLKLADVERLATVVYSNSDVGAACSSGSFPTRGMVIAPCSIKTMSEIATGNTANLISRAADVVLKERRRLVLMLREAPLHIGHIRNMATVTEAGANYLSAGSCILRVAKVDRRNGGSHTRARTRSFRHRHRKDPSLDRRARAPEKPRRSGQIVSRVKAWFNATRPTVILTL